MEESESELHESVVASCRVVITSDALEELLDSDKVVNETQLFAFRFLRHEEIYRNKFALFCASLSAAVATIRTVKKK